MTQPQINLQRVYLKGASLELPGSPRVLFSLPNLEVSTHLDLNVNTVELEPAFYEVVVRATLTLSRSVEGKGEVVAVIEAEQAGIFGIQDAAEKDLPAILSVGCAQVIFPYLRVNIADIMTRASLAPFHLPDINFAANFEQAMQQSKATVPGPAPVTVH